ncbi:MAG: aspartate 1-decarboxylase [Clostridium sp.]|jgi:aspartate 1-decarboxylase|uniref:aspartate 1-decarboxylase n=1 Tax=Clostridium sp. TaxID=1506 RepID=UPI0025BD1CE1|nr:aspartate 1-decarboxylase [Clostridium sp.]MCH3963758.1 aspartate 1-decarboxylase [Clostridium sp.]MCI1714899.1 aspartate 1-decarboxylase [Clostridium sp.]MCI1798912.1 aspartate 1-decarboxylase [Clostridium sp.]MCI1813082.1 aspartate 1-decarboxylase [Clostridium sp.]MCI1869972.1 aspartate 1-decarboxylase [Clostridium sp.]
MQLNMLKSKIHRATVTEANLNYVGSITIDRRLMESANILEYEKIQVVNINNGSRIETYVIAGKKDSRTICLNGAAARYVQPGDKVILMTYCQMDQNEARDYNPIVVFVDENNSIVKVDNHENHGEIK